MTHRHTTGFMSWIWIQLDSACWLAAFWLQGQRCKALKRSPWPGMTASSAEDSQIEPFILRHTMVLPRHCNHAACNTLTPDRLW